MAAVVERQGHARAAGALYRFAIGALVGAALLGPAILTSDFTTGAVRIRLGCAFTCVDVAAVPQQAPAALDGQHRAQDAFLRAVAARPDDVEITVNLSALRPKLREVRLQTRPTGAPARASL